MHPILAHHQWSFLLHAIVIVSVRSYLLFCDIVDSKDMLTIVPVFRSFVTGVAGVHNEPSLGYLARLLEEQTSSIHVPYSIGKGARCYQ